MQGKYLKIFVLGALLLTGCTNNSEGSLSEPLSSEDTTSEVIADAKLDGEKDALYESSPVINFGIEDRASIQLLYGELGFNFYVRVEDDTPFAENDATWRNDSVEFYIDPLVDGQDTDGKPKLDDMQIRIDTRGVTEFYIGKRASDYIWSTSFFQLHKVIIRAEDHYIIEGFVAWYNFNFTEAPDQMAINFGHVDATAFGYNWGGVKGEDNTNPTTWSVFDKTGTKVFINYFPDGLFDDAIVFNNENIEFPRVDIVFADTALFLKIERNLSTRLNDNNDQYWDGSQITLIVDVAGDGGATLNNNDVKLVIRPTGDYAGTIGPGNDNGWQPWLPGSWARNGVRNIKAEVDLNGNVLGEVPTKPYYTYVRIPYGDVGITKPESIRLFRFMGSENNPSTWQFIGSDGTFVEPTTEPPFNYALLDSAYVSTFSAAKYSEFKLAQDANYVYVSFKKEISRTTPGTNFWGDPDLSYFMIDTLGNGGAAPQNDDLKLFFVPNGYLGATLGNGSGWNDPWLDGSWGVNTVPGVDLNIDTTTFDVDGKMLVKVAISKTLVGITDTSKIGLFDYSSPANENIPANYRPFTLTEGKFID